MCWLKVVKDGFGLAKQVMRLMFMQGGCLLLPLGKLRLSGGIWALDFAGIQLRFGLWIQTLDFELRDVMEGRLRPERVMLVPSDVMKRVTVKLEQDVCFRAGPISR